MGKKYVISVIGAGALGKLYGGLLFLEEHEVHSLFKSEYQTIQQQGFYELQFNQLGKTYKIDNANIHVDPKALPPSDFVLITVKTTANDHLKELLAPTLKKDTVILVIQNGIGNEEYIASLFPNHTIVSIISYAGVTRREEAMAEVFAIGELRMALFNTTDESLLQTIEDLFPKDIHPKFIVYASYKQMRWDKVLWNAPFGALSILSNKSTDILASEEPYASMIRDIMHEIQAVARSEGVEITDQTIDATTDNDRKVKGYYPSMYWDYRNGQEIEKEYILNQILKIAKANKVKIPTLEKVVADLNAKLEENAQSSAHGRRAKL
jgi:2-dehydropantoate 2-reductase